MNPSTLSGSTIVNCPGCNTAVSKDDVKRSLCCGHIYHKACLDTQLEKKNFRCSAHLCDRIITLHSHSKKIVHYKLFPTCRGIISPHLLYRDFRCEGAGTPEERVAFYQDALAQFLAPLPQPLTDAVLEKLSSSKEIASLIKNTDQNLQTLHRDVFEKFLDYAISSENYRIIVESIAQFLAPLSQPLVDAILEKFFSDKELELLIKNTGQNLDTLYRDVFEKLSDYVSPGDKQLLVVDY